MNLFLFASVFVLHLSDLLNEYVIYERDSCAVDQLIQICYNVMTIITHICYLYLLATDPVFITELEVIVDCTF